MPGTHAQLQIDRFEFAGPTKTVGEISMAAVVDPKTEIKYLVKFYPLLSAQRSNMIDEMLVLLECYRTPLLTSLHNVYLVPNKLQLAAIFEELPTHFGRVLKNKGPLPEKVLSVVLRQVLGALDYLHSKKIVHNCVAPNTIFLGAHGGIKLGNLSHCRFTSRPEITTELVGFLPQFSGPLKVMSPERLLRLDDSTPSDIWSVGCLVHELGTGYPLFDPKCFEDVLDFKACVTHFKVLPVEAHPNLTPMLKDLMDTCCHKGASFRPTARQALQHDVLLQHVRESDKMPSRWSRGEPEPESITNKARGILLV